MIDLISQIHQDHVNMARILKLIESEIDALVAEEPRDLEILDGALRYLINFADRIHHAKEDIMFARLKSVDPDTRELVEEIASEHQTIYEKGSEFHRLVQAAESGDFVLRKEIVEKGTDYLQTLFAHMRREEEDLLKRARESLSESDLAGAVDQGEGGGDPLFGERVHKEYKDLYDHIVRQYGEDFRHPAHQVV